MNIQDLMSEKLKEEVTGYKIERDTNGMSPAQVFRLTSKDGVKYLKISHNRLNNTTYDVEREKDVLRWLRGKVEVPHEIYFETYNNHKFLLMTEAKGLCLDFEHVKPEQIIKMYADTIKKFQSIDISTCMFDSSLDFRLHELEVLFKNGLCAIDDFEQGNVPFDNPGDLIHYLKENKPEQELVFSHGDISDGNIFISKDNTIESYIDWGRGGVADKWHDIALCIRNIREDMNDERYVDLFISLLDIEPDWDRIKYYSWLDELF